MLSDLSLLQSTLPSFYLSPFITEPKVEPISFVFCFLFFPLHSNSFYTVQTSLNVINLHTIYYLLWYVFIQMPNKLIKLAIWSLLHLFHETRWNKIPQSYALKVWLGLYIIFTLSRCKNKLNWWAKAKFAQSYCVTVAPAFWQDRPVKRNVKPWCHSQQSPSLARFVMLLKKKWEKGTKF